MLRGYMCIIMECYEASELIIVGGTRQVVIINGFMVL